jgi:cbb3-type cytochrome oxidase cytochrome c subunit
VENDAGQNDDRRGESAADNDRENVGGEIVKNGLTVFLASFVLLGASWIGFVVAPALQLGTEKQTMVLNSSDFWPQQRTGAATLGLQVYRANGCAACHTEQIQQGGVACDVVLTSAGKAHPEVVSNLVENLNLKNLTELEAGAAADKITAVGGKSETHIYATGGDIARGWGIRRSVAADNLYDVPVQLGTLRAGPDQADVGARLPNANILLNRLYAPESVKTGSLMPSFKFLFEVRKIGAMPSPEALNLPQAFAPAAGYEVVPKPEAQQLVAYLLSLRADSSLYEAPFTPPTVSTNAPAKK